MISATGNVTAGNLIGNLANGTSNISIPAVNGNINFSTAGNANVLILTTTGNLISNIGNILTTGLITATGNVTGGNLLTAGLMSSTGNAIHGNILTGGLISATSNVTAGNVLFGTGIVSGTGNINGGNLIGIYANGTSTINIPVASGNINFSPNGNANAIIMTTLGNLLSTGNVSVTGNVIAGNLIGPHANGTSNINIPTASGNINFSPNGNANVLIITTLGNIVSTGNASITGNITVGNLIGVHANGTSNISIPTISANILFSTAGNANVLVIANTGIVANVLAPTTATPANGVGYIGLPVSSITGTGTLTIADAGKLVYVTAASQTITIPANGSVAYPIGTAITFIAGPSATTVLIAITTDTMYLASLGTTGTRTLAAYGMATAVKVAATTWYINGAGLT